MNFIKGLVGGIGNIIPGISGSALLIILGIYKDIVSAISNLFKDFKRNFLFLLPIGMGIICGTFLFSNIISSSLDKYPYATTIVFTGLLIGTIPSLVNEGIKNGFSSKYLIAFFIAFFIGILLLVYKRNSLIHIEYSFFSLLLVGFLVSLSSIIPGISGTILLSIIGMYDTYINAISTFNLNDIIPIGIGLVIGIFLVSKFINYLIDKYYGYTFFSIIGFTISTIPALLKEGICFNKECVIGVFISILFCFLTILIFKKANSV